MAAHVPSTVAAARRHRSQSQLGPRVGPLLGLDIGGTLTKLVFFEPRVPAPSSDPVSGGWPTPAVRPCGPHAAENTPAACHATPLCVAMNWRGRMGESGSVRLRVPRLPTARDVS
jgi:hypothetical protein